MADTIKIKRSTTTATPPSLAAGELAYSENSGNLFYGRVSDGSPVVIGGATLVAQMAGIDATIDARIALANLADLSDVVAPAPSDGQVLTWVAANNRYEALAPGSGVTTFIACNDTPANYTAAAGAFVRVNSGATGLEFVIGIDGGTF